MAKPAKDDRIKGNGEPMEVRITFSAPDQIEALWPHVYPMLKKSIDEDFFMTEKSLKDMLKSDRALLMLAMTEAWELKGAAAVKIQEDKHKAVGIVALGGTDFSAWQDKINEAMTIYARESGCSHIIALGRKAWLKIWPDFTPGKTFYMKEVSHG